ncbi:heparinase II/III domain-containing protein [Sinomicrobium weinanense]|uniref:Heparinase II/III family protein n=1 Tax=Sinomicrobium weinanense TaxID=2842200 RepID=A0A926Q1C2_9FLAO|nr:heparinase II/III family protein [Sinomicrobium weinanense]MBC9794664.1 heparinase II/III family protein [Sinomicrobium weinanense]MBU3124149.1 heparinase II/III-family protein [Sinomicrobium weinanense]
MSKFFNFRSIKDPKTFLTVFFLVSTLSFQAQEKRDLLSSMLNGKENPVAATSFAPFEREEIKTYLEKLPEESQKKIISDAEEALNYNWPAIPATAYLAFKRTGDREVMQQYSRKRSSSLKKLVLGELLEHKGRFLDAIVNGSWAICEQSTWVLSAHLPSQKGGAGIPNIKEPIIDLGAGEIANLLGWTYYFFKDEFTGISPFLKKRIPDEIKDRIIIPYLERDDFWWQGFKKESFVNNWNPWCNYNVMASALLLGSSLDNDTRNEVIVKSMRSVDKFINYYKDDGACEEGPAYWDHAGGKMLEYLELLKNISGGKITLQDHPLIQNMGTYILNAHITDDYFVNFADSPTRLQADPGIIYRYGEYIQNTPMKQFASLMARQTGFFTNPANKSLDRTLHNLCNYQKIKDTPSDKENTLAFWFPQTEIAGGRTHKAPGKGFFFAAKGGYNDESHNHNDAGSFILYHEGKPLLVDIGVETYTKKTFSSERYEIWTMQSGYHNLPEINGASQAYGKNFKASETTFRNSNSELRFALDIASAYPDEAACNSWKRTYTLKRSSSPELLIRDKFELRESRKGNVLHFISALAPTVESGGKITLKETKDKKVALYFPESIFEAAVEELPLEDQRLLKAWQQDKLYRIVLKAKTQELNNTWEYKIREEKQ